ncbi:MAG: hypothetical protein MJ229_08285 [bacterium]|nr:hypothetical protein [bacterium]
MDIIKNLNDYAMTADEKLFVSFLKENIGSYACSEKIVNSEFIKSYVAPNHDFLIYTTGEADPSLLRRVG